MKHVEKINCCICNTAHKLMGLGNHLYSKHKKISHKEYYDKYIDTSEHLCSCGKPLKFFNLTVGYIKTCGDKKCIVEIMEQTKLEKYNDKHYRDTKKTKVTKLKRYNDENYVNPDKARQTRLERYNDAGYHNAEKYERTCIEKYNVKNVWQAEFAKEKSKATKLERYDDENFHNIEKAKQTNLERTGYESTFGNPEIFKKGKQTKLKRYNDENYNNSPGRGGVGKRSEKIFSLLFEKCIEQNIQYNKFIYGIVKNKKQLLNEKRINVINISKKVKFRFLDCYIETNNRQIAIEFDEKRHEKTITEDLEREQEILTKKPQLEIYRIREKDYNRDSNQVIQDLISIIKDKNSETCFNYNNLFKNIDKENAA